MTKASLFIVTSIAATALAISGAAFAHPGGGMGGGMSGGMGGGMGFGRDMGAARGGDFPDNRTTTRSDIDSSNRPMVSSRTSTTVLQRNARVDSSLSTALTRKGIALPAGGLRAACAGYHNLGNCIAALHVAHNLGVQGGFAALKGLTTGSNPVSLGAAVKQLRPSADARAAVKKANHQAKADIEANAE